MVVSIQQPVMISSLTFIVVTRIIGFHYYAVNEIPLHQWCWRSTTVTSWLIFFFFIFPLQFLYSYFIIITLVPLDDAAIDRMLMMMIYFHSLFFWFSFFFQFLFYYKYNERNRNHCRCVE